MKAAKRLAAKLLLMAAAFCSINYFFMVARK